MNADELIPLLTMSALARATNRCLSTIQEAIRSGRIAPEFICGDMQLFSESNLPALKQQLTRRN